MKTENWPLSLRDRNISECPAPPLPPEDELRAVSVSIRYASDDEVAPHQMANPYDGLKLSVSGDVVTVANWIDENIEVFHTVTGGFKYVQGAYREGIIRQLLKGGVQVFGDIAFVVS